MKLKFKSLFKKKDKKKEKILIEYEEGKILKIGGEINKDGK